MDNSIIIYFINITVHWYNNFIAKEVLLDDTIEEIRNAMKIIANIETWREPPLKDQEELLPSQACSLDPESCEACQ